jgi:hypothetical protein
LPVRVRGRSACRQPNGFVHRATAHNVQLPHPVAPSIFAPTLGLTHRRPSRGCVCILWAREPGQRAFLYRMWQVAGTGRAGSGGWRSFGAADERCGAVSSTVDRCFPSGSGGGFRAMRALRRLNRSQLAVLSALWRTGCGRHGQGSRARGHGRQGSANRAPRRAWSSQGDILDPEGRGDHRPERRRHPLQRRCLPLAGARAVQSSRRADVHPRSRIAERDLAVRRGAPPTLGRRRDSRRLTAVAVSPSGISRTTPAGRLDASAPSPPVPTSPCSRSFARTGRCATRFICHRGGTR